MIEFLKGKKTYFMAAAVYCWAIAGYASGRVTMTDAIGGILASGSLATVRAAIGKIEMYVPLIVEIWDKLHSKDQPETITFNGLTYVAQKDSSAPIQSTPEVPVAPTQS